LALVAFIGIGIYAYASFASTSLTAYPCFGAPADYTAAFDTVRGQPQDGAVTYPERRVYLSSQSWLTPNVDANSDGTIDTPPGHHSEHVHFEACFPEMETWADANASRKLDAKLTFHNVSDYTVTNITGALVDGNGGAAGGITVTPAQITEANTAANNSGSTTNIGLATIYQSYPMNQVASDGQKEFRPTINLARTNSAALVDLWFVQGFWYSIFNYAGLPTHSSDVANGPEELRTRSWFKIGTTEKYSYAGYANSLAWTATDLSTNRRPDTWTPYLFASDGTSKGSLHINPNFHIHPDDPGIWHLDNLVFNANQANIVPKSIPLSTLAGLPTVNKLVFLGHRWPQTIPGPNPISTAVTSIPFLY
jgi:hypothetical protein